MRSQCKINIKLMKFDIYGAVDDRRCERTRTNKSLICQAEKCEASAKRATPSGEVSS